MVVARHVLHHADHDNVAHGPVDIPDELDLELEAVARPELRRELIGLVREVR
eukprot:CAMPEP_0195127562 /NCGR_PEP_ID=MMETSP0448-20130528/137286_1 /TAXON_ID=66468 /ORGANISM="Heterocapsa triquestra, Strain CCMP 448" /LENGTH=51 /DNA_ID=CAMNT_0040165317 /DNA_START=127 /DNA_END=279 /DNA_ORIENTATION=-